jgi:hypothetical protein
MYGNDEVKKNITGVVMQKKLGGKSKSAHTGFVLHTPKRDYVLRREGGNPFYDSFFEAYENKTLTIEGFDMDVFFLVTGLKEAVVKKGKK